MALSYELLEVASWRFYCTAPVGDLLPDGPGWSCTRRAWSAFFTKTPEAVREGYPAHLERAVGREGDFDAQQRVEPLALFGREGVGRDFGVGL